MVEAVYFGTLIPLLFLILVIKGEYRRLILFFSWGLTSAILVYLLNILAERYFVIDEAVLLTQLIPVAEEFIKALPILFMLRGRKTAPLYSIIRLAMAVGIGFSILENYLYLSLTAEAGIADSIFFIITRSLTACVLHGSMTALTGYAVQHIRDTGNFSAGLLAGMFVLSVVIHSFYNLAGLTERLQFLGIVIPVFLFLVEYYLFNFFGRKMVARKDLL